MVLNKNMLIAIDASRANKKHKTGTEWYSFYLIQELKKIIPADVRVILYSREPLSEKLAVLPPNWSAKILRSPFKYLWTQFNLSWEMLWHKSDILFVSAHALPLIGAKKNVAVIHDIGFEEFPELYKPLALWYHRFSAKLARDKAKVIISPSEFTKNKMVEIYKCDPNKIKVIPLGYQSDIFNTNYDLLSCKKTLVKYGIEGPFIMTVSRLEKKKNITTLIDAFKLLTQKWPELKLVLVGQPGYGYDEIKQKLNNKVIQTGWLSAKRIAMLYNQAQAFVFPTLYEGFGLPILEAQACGCPVVVSNICSCPEVGGNGALYFDPHNPQELAVKIASLIESPDLKQDLINKGFENFKKYSWNKTALETWEIMKDL